MPIVISFLPRFNSHQTKEDLEVQLKEEKDAHERKLFDMTRERDLLLKQTEEIKFGTKVTSLLHLFFVCLFVFLFIITWNSLLDPIAAFLYDMHCFWTLVDLIDCKGIRGKGCIRDRNAYRPEEAVGEGGEAMSQEDRFAL